MGSWVDTAGDNQNAHLLISLIIIIIMPAKQFHAELLVEITNEPRHEKTNVLVFVLVGHKPGSTATEDG